MAYLELNNIRKAFANTVAVENFELQVQRGEFVTFLGPSGCGKTTTMRMVAGFERPDHGRIVLDGKDITDMPPNKRDVGMVFQSYALFPHLSTRDNIGFGLSIARSTKTEIARRVDEMLDLIQMRALGARYPHQLSGGQQQRVALARAIAIRPQVLLLDEPLSALDAKIRVELRNEIRAIQQRLGITTIYVTHDQEEAMSLSDRVVVMNHGHIEQVGAPFTIYNFPATQFVAAFVGTLNKLVGTLVLDGGDTLSVEGAHIQLAAPQTGRRAGEKLQLNVRPETISLTHENGSAQAHGDNVLPAVVERINFLGAVVRIGVKSGELPLVVDLFNNPSLVLPKPGDMVRLRFAPQACQIM